MARIHTVPKIFQFSLYFTVILCCFTNYVSANQELDEDNWRNILDGEWMVEFYAPWCPACSALAPAWKELSQRAGRKSLLMKTAAVDVTKSPGLSGRFVVTALPTIFHVKQGDFRQYKGPRDVDSMLSYVEQQRWKQTDPIPSWKAPNSLQMGFVAEFFKLSQALRTVHNMLMEEYGLPTWGSYLIFAIGTIFIGAILGLILVCVIDLLYPPRRSDKMFVPQAEVDRRARGDQDNGTSDANRSDDDDLELINDDIVDDDEDEAGHAAAEKSDDNDPEKNSNCDTSDEEKEAAEGGGDSDGKVDSKPAPEVRKRRPRKAD